MTRANTPAISPMHPMLVREPFHRDGWVFEEKYDGWRMLAFRDGGDVRLVSRNGRNHTARFPEIARAIGRLPARSYRRSVLEDAIGDGHHVSAYAASLRMGWTRGPR